MNGEIIEIVDEATNQIGSESNMLPSNSKKTKIKISCDSRDSNGPLKKSKKQKLFISNNIFSFE